MAMANRLPARYGRRDPSIAPPPAALRDER
jgi:hypothetical protein